jgi:hypothetical protein
MTVVEVEITANGVLELAGAAMDAAPQLLLGQGREPTLDQIEPRGAGRGEVQVEARMAQEPALDRRSLVGGIIVEDQMEVEGGRYGRFDGLQKLAKLDRPMALMQLPNHGAGPGVERREQGGRAIAQVELPRFSGRFEAWLLAHRLVSSKS